MCNCSSFTGNRPSYITADEFTGNRPSYITSDFDGQNEFDNFLTKKSRERRKQVKAGMQSGLSKEDAKKQALASIPKTKLKDIINRIKNGESINVVQTPLGDVNLDPKVDKKLDELSDALKNDSTNTNNDSTNTNTDTNQPSFFEKNKLYIYGGVALVVGIFVYIKYIKK